MFDSILVVCVGNICRSPTGERLLSGALPQKRVSSAGISAMTGCHAEKIASEIAAQHGISLEGHVARQLTSTMCRDADLILVMEKNQVEQVAQINPAVRGKTMLFGHWLNQREISDPYRKSRDAFEATYGLLEDAARKWVNVLRR